MADQAIGQARPQSINLLKVLGPVHVWALGVGIVLVGEFMGWNYAVGKGGALGCLIAMLGDRAALYLRRHDRFGDHLDGGGRRRTTCPS